MYHIHKFFLQMISLDDNILQWEYDTFHVQIIWHCAYKGTGGILRKWNRCLVLFAGKTFQPYLNMFCFFMHLFLFYNFFFVDQNFSHICFSRSFFYIPFSVYKFSNTHFSFHIPFLIKDFPDIFFIFFFWSIINI